MDLRILRGKPPELLQIEEFLLLSFAHNFAKYGEPGPRAFCTGAIEDLSFRDCIDYRGSTNHPSNSYGDSRTGECW